MTPLVMLWWLIVGHAIMDFWAQSDALAMLKNRYRNTSPFLPWYYALIAHALHHGAAVAFITGRVDLGIAETVAHAGIDAAKNENWINIHVDQALHLGCKVLWLYLVAPK